LERAFRNGKLINGVVDKSSTEAINKLEQLIDYYKKTKADFKTMDEY